MSILKPKHRKSRSSDAFLNYTVSAEIGNAMLKKTNRNRGARAFLEINEVISQSDQSLVSGSCWRIFMLWLSCELV